MASGSSRTSVKEYTIKVPKHVQKRHHVMRFNATLDVDFEKWKQVKMERENNMKEFKGTEEDQPKFGAGSEFGREAKEEARRKKLGIISRKYKPDDQPWILKSYGSTVKKFKGIREGGVSENAAYYVFTHAANQVIEAFPLHEWYKFQPIQRYKALSAEEAEQEFSKRNKHLNFFSLMLRKRLKGDDDAEVDGEVEEGKSKKGGKSKELKISEMDEWMDSSDGDSDEEAPEKEEDDEEKPDKKKIKKNDAKKKKNKKRDTDVEAFEDSDDGDGEGRELDYITDSSDSEPENTKLEGVAEEKALRKLLNSDEESENDSDKSDKEMEKEDEENKDKDEEKEGEAEKDKKNKNNKKKKTKKDPKKDAKEKKGTTDSDFSSDSSTDEDVKKKKVQQKKNKKEKGDDKAKPEQAEPSSSRSGTPTIDGKRKMPDLGGPIKKPKLEAPINYIPGSLESGITEDAVRKYLMRKPMTTTELLQKFKSKKTGLSSEQLVNIMTQILKKINPVKQTLKGKMYLSIKS
ncbi:PREDICTED: general transcription factor IIF subunit 1 isoform X2 [Nicrophorus vespilloides]|uniref:Transcription initiation factor IIF subunit alpha n=1 Tax=Nicrophorus vespilloides TaxID=110193 RepID=A0ABM1MEB1_NICVS|nr:PREDICTED: general transcription factor IIF subunit 1 isoform X2 [Nicrophorus vespilloides]